MAYVLVGEPASTSPKHALARISHSGLVLVSSPCARVRSGSPPESRPTKTETHCHLYHSVRSKLSPPQSLLKTGISADLPGDYREILAKVAVLRRLETRREYAKTPQMRAFRAQGASYLWLSDCLADLGGIELAHEMSGEFSLLSPEFELGDFCSHELRITHPSPKILWLVECSFSSPFSQS